MEKVTVLPEIEMHGYDSYDDQFGFVYIINNFNKLPHVQNFRVCAPINKENLLINKIKAILPENTIYNKVHSHRLYNKQKCEIESYERVYSIQSERFIILIDSVKENLYYVDEKDRDVGKYCVIKIFAESEEAVPSELTKIIMEHADNNYEPPKENSGINVIRQTNTGFALTNIALNKSEVDIDLHYNDDFKEIHEKVVSSISNKSKSLFLFHGIPGTGKTSYLRYLASIVDRKFIFVPPNLTNALSSPSFIEFLLEQKNSCLVIEDAENILKKRVTGSSQEMSNLLNITDGLLSDVLNISVICTFNSPLSEIDDALMRKGRLTVRYEFGKLSKEKTNRLAEKLNLPLPNKELSLADTFNYEDDSYVTSRASIGFNLK